LGSQPFGMLKEALGALHGALCDLRQQGPPGHHGAAAEAEELVGRGRSRRQGLELLSAALLATGVDLADAYAHAATYDRRVSGVRFPDRGVPKKKVFCS
jgi:hypothetical protein